MRGIALGAALVWAASLHTPALAADDASVSLNEALQTCSGIEDDAARLACVDVILNRLDTPATPPPPPVVPAPVAPAPAEPAVAPPVAPAPAVTPPQEPRAAPVRRAAPQRALVDLHTLHSGRLPETRPDLFGAKDLSPEAFSTLIDSLDGDIVLDGEEVQSITMTVERHGYTRRGKAYVVLENGQIWRATRAGRLAFSTRTTQQAEIVRGWLGAFRMSLDGGRYVAVERVK